MRKHTILYIFTITAILLSFNCKKNSINVENLKKGEIFVAGLQSMPASLNYFIDYNTTSVLIGGMLYESLCTRDPVTLELKGLLAKSWSVSEDKTTYTFKLNPDAKWADGSPVTTEDAIFTYETIMNPENLTGLFRSGYEDEFEKIYASDKYTLVFKAKQKRWTNLISASSFTILPKKYYENKDFNKDFNLSLPDGSGPYKLKTVQTDRYIQLEKREDYWGYKLPYQKDYYKFKEIQYKIISDEEIQYESLKKGDIDFLAIYSAFKWYNRIYKNPIEAITKNWISAKRVWNYRPIGFQSFYMNMRRDKFKDVRVRKAMNLLLNFDLLQEKLMYKQYVKINSYFPEYFNNDREPIKFDTDEARRLLTEAGWDEIDSDGVLKNKNGDRFEVDFTYHDQSVEKHLTIYKEECGKVGIMINLNLVAPSAYRKKCFVDYDYDMIWVNWSGTLFPEIEGLWRGKYGDEVNSNNVGGYKNDELDKLLDIYLEEFDESKRRTMMKTIDDILTVDYPTVLLWTAPYTRLMYWNKFDMPEDILGKYSDEDAVNGRWSVSSDKEKALIDALINNVALPAENIEYYYDSTLIK